MGTSSASANCVLKEVWAYIKNHKLQDPSNRTDIVCDDTFEKLFHKKRFSILKLSKYLHNVSTRVSIYNSAFHIILQNSVEEQIDSFHVLRLTHNDGS